MVSKPIDLRTFQTWALQGLLLIVECLPKLAGPSWDDVMAVNS
jgi:hypothetical protein